MLACSNLHFCGCFVYFIDCSLTVLLLPHFKTLKKKSSTKKPWNITTNHQPHPQSAFSFIIILFPFHYCFWESHFLFLWNLWEILCFEVEYCSAMSSDPWWDFYWYSWFCNLNVVNFFHLSFQKCSDITWKAVEGHGSPEWQKDRAPPPQGQSQTQKAAAQRVRKWATLNHVIVACVVISYVDF